MSGALIQGVYGGGPVLAPGQGITMARAADTTPSPDDPTTLRAMIASRMRWHLQDGLQCPFYFLHTIRRGDRVNVFVVVTEDREPVILEDDYAMFPSDKLISSLRLLLS